MKRAVGVQLGAAVGLDVTEALVVIPCGGESEMVAEQGLIVLVRVPQLAVPEAVAPQLQQLCLAAS